MPARDDEEAFGAPGRSGDRLLLGEQDDWLGGLFGRRTLMPDSGLQPGSPRIELMTFCVAFARGQRFERFRITCKHLLHGKQFVRLRFRT
jgi:hypothetical protein